MILELENGNKINNPTEAEILEAVELLDGVDNSYLSLEDENGNYIQVGGGKINFKVEVREIFNLNEFCHWEAEDKEVESNNLCTVFISGRTVAIREKNIIGRDLIISLLKDFLLGIKLSSRVNWKDITDMFKDD